MAWLGSDDVGRAQFPDAQIVDLDGAFVAPAFVDSHIHLTAPDCCCTGLDLSAATSRRHCLEMIGDFAAGTRAGRSGVTAGTTPPGRATPRPPPPTLDTLVGTAPAYLARIDVHSAVASTALRDLVAGLAAVDGFHPQRPLSAEAHHLVRAEARRLLTWQQRDEARRAALDAAAAAGIVAVHECAGPDIGGSEDWQNCGPRSRRRGGRLLG